MLTTSRPAGRHHHEQSSDVVEALTRAGLVAAGDTERALDVVDHALDHGHEGGGSLRQRLPEVAGYLGAAFVAAAVALLVAREWADLGLAVRVGLLAAVSIVLLGGAATVVRLSGGRNAVRTAARTVSRRLASTLATGGAAAGAGAVGVWLVDLEESGHDLQDGSVIGLGAGSTLVVLALTGYFLAPSLLGQLATFAGTAYTAVFLVQTVELPPELWAGLALYAVGALWLTLAEGGLWTERQAARGLGLAVALLGAQTTMGQGDRWIAYALTSVLAVAGFAVYMGNRAWPYLAAGVVGFTVVVPEIVLDVTDGSSLGTGLALLAAGGTLLGASLVGVRLHRVADRE